MFRERNRLTISIITFYLMTVTLLRKITVRITNEYFSYFFNFVSIDAVSQLPYHAHQVAFCIQRRLDLYKIM